MAWQTPKTWTSGSAVTAAELNQEVRDNLNALRAERVVGGYTEGTWTPAFTVDGSGTPGSEGYGSYTKVGRLVHATGYLVGNRGTAALGSVFISSLPFAAAASVPAWAGWVAYGQGFLSVTGSLGIAVASGATDVSLYINDNGTSAAMAYTNLPLSPDCTIMFAISYEAA